MLKIGSFLVNIGLPNYTPQEGQRSQASFSIHREKGQGRVMSTCGLNIAVRYPQISDLYVLVSRPLSKRISGNTPVVKMGDKEGSQSVELVGKILIDGQNPLKERFRALFTLKNLGGSVAVKFIAKCFADPSSLLKHECAYCLGQMQDNSAIPLLSEVLRDTRQEPIVRHEAGILYFF